MGIKKVLLCGLGAVGLTYANKLKDVCELKILADCARVDKYKKNPLELNGKKITLKYITPDKTWTPDLIMITTKSNGLDSAIEYIKNYVNDKTIIISLINGVTSESRIAEVYGWNKVLHSYFIGHSAVREENKVSQDGVGKIIFGSPHKENAYKVKQLAEFFKTSGIDYEIPEDIIYSLWLKFTLNVFSNQVSAITNMTFGELKNGSVVDFAKGIIAEVAEIAEAEGVKGIENFETDTLNALSKMTDSGKTSMLQDVLAKRKTEVDIFAGEIIRLGELHGIQTPYNQVMHDMIKNLEETF
jgi:2-dehydropantoate 2-reductase